MQRKDQRPICPDRCHGIKTASGPWLLGWRLSAGVEADLLVNGLECAIEYKSSATIRSAHLKGLRELPKEHPDVQRRLVVSIEPVSRRTPDGIDVLGIEDFLDALWDGALS